MVQLPIGFFMPLPLPIMIPFMMWQSAAIAAGFGTYFQFAKRKVSAMSNEEFNNANPHDLVDALYADIVKNIPSSFTKIESLTPIILDSMLKMLTDAATWFSQILGGGGLPDIAHHLAGLPGHVGHSVLGEDGDSGTDTGTDTGDNVHAPIHVNNVPSQSISWLTNAINKIRNSQHGHPHYDTVTSANIEKEFALRKKIIPPDDIPPTIDSFKFDTIPKSMMVGKGFHKLTIADWTREGQNAITLRRKVNSRFAAVKRALNVTRISPQARAILQTNLNAIIAIIAYLNKFIPNR